MKSATRTLCCQHTSSIPNVTREDNNSLPSTAIKTAQVVNSKKESRNERLAKFCYLCAIAVKVISV